MTNISPFRRLLYVLANKWNNVVQDAQRHRLLNNFKSCGQNVAIYMPVWISGAHNMTVGDEVAISAFVHIWAEGGLRIGNRVMIAAHSAITTLTHDHQAEVMKKTLVQKEIIIEDDVWIGSNATILPGVKIGRGAVVGAGATVTKDVEPYSIVTGTPATLLKYRQINSSSMPSMATNGLAARNGQKSVPERS